MNPIFATGYNINFNQNGYQLLNKHLIDNKYSSIFIIVDNNSNEYCLPIFLPYLETNLSIEIIEIDNEKFDIPDIDSILKLKKKLIDKAIQLI